MKRDKDSKYIYITKKDQYRVLIYYAGKRIPLGQYDRLEEAKLIRDNFFNNIRYNNSRYYNTIRKPIAAKILYQINYLSKISRDIEILNKCEIDNIKNALVSLRKLHNNLSF